MSKLTTLDQLKLSLQASKTYIDQQDAIQSGQIANISDQIADIVSDIEGIVATGGQANSLEGAKVNGQASTITDKMVFILFVSGE